MGRFLVHAALRVLPLLEEQRAPRSVEAQYGAWCGMGMSWSRANSRISIGGIARVRHAALIVIVLAAFGRSLPRRDRQLEVTRERNVRPSSRHLVAITNFEEPPTKAT